MLNEVLLPVFYRAWEYFPGIKKEILLLIFNFPSSTSDQPNTPLLNIFFLYSDCLFHKHGSGRWIFLLHIKFNPPWEKGHNAKQEHQPYNYISVPKSSEFQSGPSVLKMVLNMQFHPYLWRTMWFHTKKSKETLKQSTLNIADFTT